jgi:hypothetical protein
MVKTTPPDSSGYADDCGIDDFHPADCSRMREPTVTHHGIFENAFADKWTTSEPDPLTHSAIIDHIIQICDLPADSIMVKYIGEQQWSTLAHVVSVGLDEVGHFFTVRKDGFTFEDTPMLIHLRKFKAFLLYYKRKTCWGDGPNENDVMLWTPKDFSQYCCTKVVLVVS